MDEYETVLVDTSSYEDLECHGGIMDGETVRVGRTSQWYAVENIFEPDNSWIYAKVYARCEGGLAGEGPEWREASLQYKGTWSHIDRRFLLKVSMESWTDRIRFDL